MADIGAAIFHQLSSDTGVNTIVGIGSAARVYPTLAEQVDPYPLIVYTPQDDQSPETFDGHTGFHNQLFVLSCCCLDFDSTVILAKAVRAVFDSKSGTWAGIVMQGSFYEDSHDVRYSVANAGQDLTVYARELTVRFIWHD